MLKNFLNKMDSTLIQTLKSKDLKKYLEEKEGHKFEGEGGNEEPE
jgi:hypothetical protein